MHILERLPQEQLDLFRNVRRQRKQQLQSGLFYAEGEQVFAALLRSDIEISTILITPRLFEKYHLVMSERDLAAFIADKNSIEQASERRLNQGVVALAKVPESHPIEDSINRERCLIVALNGIDHAVNVGSILRNCAAFDVSFVIFDAATAHPYSSRSVQASIGGVFQVPVHASGDLADLLKRIQQQGVLLVAADPSGNTFLSDLKLSDRICLILGNEHHGISKNILELVIATAAIPVQKVDSLNVAAASAIFLYEISSGRNR